MIDVLIDETGNMVIAHDRDSLPRLASLTIERSTGALRYSGAQGEQGLIGTMAPAMVEAAGNQGKSTVVQLEGFQVAEPYSCELTIA